MQCRLFSLILLLVVFCDLLVDKLTGGGGRSSNEGLAGAAGEPYEDDAWQLLPRRGKRGAMGAFVVPPSARSMAESSSHADATSLFRFALVADSHLWPPSADRVAFMSGSDAKDVRDGLLVGRSPETYSALLGELAAFARSGGAFAVHAGDAVCGGNSFGASAHDFEAQLRAAARAEQLALPRGWSVHHLPGNHDLHPIRGGLSSWASVLGNATLHEELGGAHYRSVRRHGWRLVLLDSASAVGIDSNGHGLIAADQVRRAVARSHTDLPRPIPQRPPSHTSLPRPSPQRPPSHTSLPRPVPQRPSIQTGHPRLILRSLGRY